MPCTCKLSLDFLVHLLMSFMIFTVEYTHKASSDLLVCFLMILIDIQNEICTRVLMGFPCLFPCYFDAI